MRRPSLLLALAVAVPLALPAQRRDSAQAATGTNPPRTTNRIQLTDYLDWETVSDPQLSPDGKQIVFARRWVDKLNDKHESSLWVMNADGSRPHFLVTGTAPRWSPDGTRIAYIAPGQPTGTQIWVRYMDAEGAATQVTRITETPGEVQWSPDGKSLAFVMNVPARDEWRVAMPAAPKGAKWTEPPRIITRLSYRRDGTGFVEEGFRHIFTVSADGGTPRQVTSGDWSHSNFEWMPDGKSIVMVADRVENQEYRWRQSDIYSVDVTTGAIRQLTRRSGPDNDPVPSPDGRLIAYVGNDSTDDTWIDTRLYVMNADGSNPRAINGNMDRSPSGLMWAPDGSGVYFNAESEGTRNLYFASLAGAVSPVTKGSQVLTVSDIARNGLAVGVMSTSQRPADIVTFAVKATPGQTQGVGQPRFITAVNEDVLAGKQIGQVEEIWYRSVDNMRIQGWIVKPPNFDPSRKYPLILTIHGGPHSMYNGGFNFALQEHAANGYVVLYTNPRGSTGYGSAFGNAIKNAYPSKDFDDLMAGVDTVIGRGYVDTKNLFVYGCSGGGVLTAWTVGHTDRFAAAVVQCPVINWLSFVGTTDGPSWYRNFAKLPWEDPSEHLRRSPLMYVGNVKTPTMLMTGVNDLRTPISQTEEFYEALKMRRVPTAMMRFNNEWHGTSSTPSNFLRTQLYLRSWFQKYGTKTEVSAVGGQQ